MSEKIVVVDDEKEIADLIELYLSGENYDVHCFYNGNDGMDYIEKNKVDLAILDVMLPDIDGFTMCRKIREKYLFPIVMVTAKVEAVDKIAGLNLGADDYITKPFLPLELIARVKTQLRRYKQYNTHSGIVTDNENEDSEISIRGLFISRKTHKCILNEKEISLTPIEFDLLWYLCQNQGEVISSEKLYEEVWKEKYLDSNNTVMAHIARLREKMNEPARKPKYIKTIWGVGYTIE